MKCERESGDLKLLKNEEEIYPYQRLESIQNVLNCLMICDKFVLFFKKKIPETGNIVLYKI